MVERKVSKSQSQRKRRGDCCINNLKIKLNPSSYSTEINKSNQQQVRKSQTKSQKANFIRGSSLDNISNLQCANITNDKFTEQEYSTLRRTRSLAISSREDPFYSLNYCEYKADEEIDAKNPRKVQLIPRARISNKSFIKDLKEDSWWFEDFTSRKVFKESNDFKRSTSNQNLPDTDKFQDSEKFNPKKNLEDSSRKKSTRNFHNFPSILSNDQLPKVTDNLPITSFNGKQFPLKNTITASKGFRECISYDENIVLKPPPPQENQRCIKLRTLRGPIPYENFDYSKLPQFDIDHDKKQVNEEVTASPTLPQLSVSPTKKNDEILIEPFNYEFETDTNCDEIKLNNEKIVKEGQSENDFIIDENKQLTEVEDFKTVISVEDNIEKNNNNNSSKKSHSHNYLKDILESQKGSKLPLQSFITKKLSNLTRRSSKCNLTENSNNFVSLPDINKDFVHPKSKIPETNTTKHNNNNNNKVNENRFIINIGRFFDVTTATSQTVNTYCSSPPASSTAVDFEVKIAKVKKNKKKETDFKDVVNKVNKTLQKNGFSSLDVINNTKEQTDIKNMDPEVLQKVDSVRNYWMKIIDENNNNKTEINNEIAKKNSEKESTKLEVDKTKSCVEPLKGKSSLNNGKSSGKVKISKSSENLMEPESIKEPTGSSTKTGLSKSNSINVPDFNQVRYRVIKSDLFHKKLLANHIDFNQFDELIEYVEDQSLKDLLNNNNIVIIEPIRSKSNALRPKDTKDANDTLRKQRHFFYHSVRMNKEVNDDELPNPEVVRQARKFFEQAERNTENERYVNHHHYRHGGQDPDKDKCSMDLSDCEDTFDSIETECCNEYISEDILAKIRQYGSTVTYYGGKVIDQHRGQSVLTDIIMDEIRNNETRCMECRKKNTNNKQNPINNEYIKYKLVKSNSCNSRLELATVPDEMLFVTSAKQSKTTNQHKRNNIKMNNEVHNNSIKYNNNTNNGNAKNKSNFQHIDNNKNAINERIKSSASHHQHHQPKIIGGERKEYKPSSSVVYNANSEIKNYEYREKIQPIKLAYDMEFESYEVA